MLDGVDLVVGAGTVTALLGPNGAGKTTTVHVLSTLVRPDGGTARVAGHDVVREPDAVRAVIGLTGQFSAVDTLLTGEENLLLMARLRHLGPQRSRARVAELLEQLDLVEVARKPLAVYSGGLRRRLDLAMTLVTTPDVIFLDEPTTGPRPAEPAHDVGDRPRPGRRGHHGAADHAVPGRGRRARRPGRRARRRPGRRRTGPPTSSSGACPAGTCGCGSRRRPTLDAATRLLPGSVPDAGELALTVPSDGGVVALRTVLDRLAADDLAVDDLSIHRPDLDDVFFALTGRGRTEGTPS